MSDLKKLDQQLAEISLVKSGELVRQAQDTNTMVEMHEKISQSIDKAKAVKDVLASTTPRQVSVSFGTLIDKQLQRIGVFDSLEQEQEEIAGVEQLGLTLKPDDYLKSRIKGCESFISSMVKKSKEIVISISEAVRDRYILVRESNASLMKRFEELDQALKDTPKMNRGDFKIKVPRGGAVFQVGGVIKEDWGNQLTRVNKTMTALVTSYYRNNRSASNELISFFGGFNGLSEEAALNRFYALPISISTYTFKECMFPVPNAGDGPNYKTLSSVELLGGYAFVNAFFKKRPSPFTNIKDTLAFLDTMLNTESIQFVHYKNQVRESDAEVDSLSTADMKAIILLGREVLTKAEKLFSEGDTYSIEGKDFVDVISTIDDADWSNDTKHVISKSFERIALKYNKEMLSNRVNVVQYLTLLLNALIGLCTETISK